MLLKNGQHYIRSRHFRPILRTADRGAKSGSDKWPPFRNGGERAIDAGGPVVKEVVENAKYALIEVIIWIDGIMTGTSATQKAHFDQESILIFTFILGGHSYYPRGPIISKGNSPNPKFECDRVFTVLGAF